ncbi:siderophore-interacting protein [Paracoccus onubensis]|uniref:Siderophore-interacting protein n=1 Tax=Paracoccus onubensis TaxID=1675788 RepID=A0A418SVC5_9RHOB|nr:siderophore-interacting protein [Paracoccus onubensis]RJE84889.1 siderophore-interacting protein [Paracoccus onubensis]
MSQLQTFRSTGIIPHLSGAAVAALKARASAWEVPLIESPDQLSMFVWDCELRLKIEPDCLRIDLSGPEARLIGILRDSATELFEEAGLTAEWDQLDIGALAPGLSLLRVESVASRTPGFIRVRVTGPEAGRFAERGLHFRLLLPPSGRDPVWPRISASGRTDWPKGEDALHRPVYTVVAQADDWLDFDIFRHANSPTCDWALSEPVGQPVGILGPGGGWCPNARRLWLFGDETALPAIARMLDLAEGEVFASISASVMDLAEMEADHRVTQVGDLLSALREHERFGEDDFVWFAGPADQAREARKHLTSLGLPKKSFTAAAYWG